MLNTLNTIRFIKRDEYVKMIEDIIDNMDISYVQNNTKLYKDYFVKTLVDDKEYPYNSPTDLYRWIKLSIIELFLLNSTDSQYDSIRQSYDVYHNDICTYDKNTYIIVGSNSNNLLLLPY